MNGDNFVGPNSKLFAKINYQQMTLPVAGVKLNQCISRNFVNNKLTVKSKFLKAIIQNIQG